MGSQNSISRRLSSFANRFYPLNVIQANLARSLFFWKKVKKQNWYGEDIIIPFIKNRSNAVKMAGFNRHGANNEITDMAGFNGTVRGANAITGSARFFNRDLIERGPLRLQTFIPTMIKELDAIVDRMSTSISLQIGTGPWIASATSAGASTGRIKVDKIYVFDIDMQIVAGSQQGTASPVNPGRYWVTDIDLQAETITLSATKGGAAFNSSAWTTAKRIKFYVNTQDISTIKIVEESAFHSIRGNILRVANGGHASIYGLAKTSHYALDALNFNGGNIVKYAGTAGENHLLRAIFRAYGGVLRRGLKPMINDVVMSMQKYAACIEILEDEKSGYNIVDGTTVGDKFAWHEIRVHGPDKKALNIVGVREWDDNLILFPDWNTWTFYTNRGIQLASGLNPNEMFYWVRPEDGTGSYYLADFQCYGQLVCDFPLNNFMIHSVPSAVNVLF